MSGFYALAYALVWPDVETLNDGLVKRSVKRSEDINAGRPIFGLDLACDLVKLDHPGSILWPTVLSLRMAQDELSRSGLWSDKSEDL